MKNHLERLKSVIPRLLLAYCIVYTLTSLLIDHGSSTYTGISETACSPKPVEADSYDELRQLLVDVFAPTLVFSPGEPTNLREEVAVPYQIVSDMQDMGRYVVRGAVTYPTDYGATSFGVRLSIGSDGHSFWLSKTVLRTLGWIFGQAHVDSHNGDVEMFELYLKPSEEIGYWEIDSLSLFPHGQRTTYSADEIHCFRDSPILYVSRGKHAMYPTLQECNHSSVARTRGVQLTAEHCSIGELYFPAMTPEFDVGDSEDPVNVFETSPTLVERELFQGEDVWGECFLGGHGDGSSDAPCRARFRWW